MSVRTEETMLHSQLHEAYDQLVHQLMALHSGLKQDQQAGYSHWVPRSELEISADIHPIDQACEIYLALFFFDGQDSHETISRHGLISASENTLSKALLVNEAKTRFKSCISAIRVHFPQRLKIISHEFAERHPAIRMALRGQSLNRLHLKQCYRHIPVFTQRPTRIGFTWSMDNRSITRVSVMEAEQRLLKLGEEKDHVQAQLNKLYNLNGNNSGSLRKVQLLPPCVKANCVFDEQGKISRKILSCPMPILIPGYPHEPLPSYKHLSIEPPKERTRPKRLDNKLSQEAFLPSINVYLSEACA